MRADATRENINASEPSECRLDPAARLRGIGRIDFVRAATPALTLREVDDIRRWARIGIICQGNVAAGFNKSTRYFAADPTAGSRNECHLAGKVDHWTTRLQSASTVSRVRPRVINTICDCRPNASTCESRIGG